MFTIIISKKKNNQLNYLSTSLHVHQIHEFFDMAAFIPMPSRRNCISKEKLKVITFTS